MVNFIVIKTKQRKNIRKNTKSKLEEYDTTSDFLNTGYFIVRIDHGWVVIKNLISGNYRAQERYLKKIFKENYRIKVTYFIYV